MYTPKPFDQPDLSQLRALMRAHPLATLVSATAEGVDAEHVPVLCLDSPGPFGTLQGHVAAASPVSTRLEDQSEVLAIFQGPNHYVSPKWYPTKREHGKVVPTWNYVVVHARGPITWHRDPAWLRAHLERAVEVHEDENEPWRLSDAPAEFIGGLLGAIVGFEIPIVALTGKWKVSQNRNEADRRGVVKGLRGTGTPAALQMLEWMDEGDA